MVDIELEVPPIGVKVLKSRDGLDDVKVFHGASYCEAVRLATPGEEVLVAPGSIDVCKWSPVILGLKQAEGSFEKKLGPRVDEALAGYYLAPMSSFREGLTPDVVIVRGRPEQLREITDSLGEAALVRRYWGEIGKTALGVGESGGSLKVKVTYGLNRVLARLRKLNSWDRFTRFAFRSRRVTSALEKLIKNNMADMSMCRNSTVIPYLENAANVSLFCTGAIAWGANSPAHMTSGLPFELFEKVSERLEYPGKRSAD